MPRSEPETNFEGHPGRECGEHRTVGAHRAWCYDCTEWCYPSDDGACKGCELPAVRARAVAAEAGLAAAQAKIAAVGALIRAAEMMPPPRRHVSSSDLRCVLGLPADEACRVAAVTTEQDGTE